MDLPTLRTGMKSAAALGMIVAVHAENNHLAAKHTAAARRFGLDVRAWLSSRPVELELAAIREAISLAGETGCALHIVHVSSPEGLALITGVKEKGVNISAETCPHYLLLDDGDVLRQGASAKCAPPLRSGPAREGLWRALENGCVDTIGSDHSPAPPEMKSSADFFEVWGGISGCQHGFPLLLSEAITRAHEQVLPRSIADGRRPPEPRMHARAVGRSVPRFAAMLADNVARRFRLPHKGMIAEGFDADLTLLNLRENHFLNTHDLLYRHRQGPYGERLCKVRVVRTFVRGHCVWSEGRIAPDAPRGRFIAPSS